MTTEDIEYGKSARKPGSSLSSGNTFSSSGTSLANNEDSKKSRKSKKKSKKSSSTSSKKSTPTSPPKKPSSLLKKRRKKSTVVININTQSSPFQIPKELPLILEELQDEEEISSTSLTKEWNSFCKEVDKNLFPIEETIAKVKIVNVIFTIFYLAIIITGVCIYFKAQSNMEPKVYIVVGVGIFVFAFHLYLICHSIGKEFTRRSINIQEVCIDYSESSSEAIAHTYIPILYQYQCSNLARVGWDDRVEAKILLSVGGGGVGSKEGYKYNDDYETRNHGSSVRFADDLNVTSEKKKKSKTSLSAVV